MSSKSRPCVFLDRDGVLNKDLGYVYKVEDLFILDEVKEALSLLKSKGYLLIVVTNQSGVARGKFSLEEVSKFNDALQKKMEINGTYLIDQFYCCPHYLKGVVKEYSIDCSCRKPKVGMIKEAMKDFSIDLANSFVVGDKASDIDLAHNMGIRGIQIRSQYELHENPDAVCNSLLEATKVILS